MVSLGGMVAEGLLLDSPFLQPTPARLATDLADAEGAILEGVTSDDLPRQKMLVSDAVYDLLVAHIPELNALTRVLFVRRTLEPGGVKELLAPFAAATDPAGKATALGRVKCPPTLKLVTGDGVFRTHASIRNTGPIAEDRRGDDHEHRRLWN